ncbi:MAG: 30S ribosome-binding factor RbfA [Clostridia bacterium]|nr:30S ribosome-binding factor RbfA [Clostridia bacterium]
MAGNRRARIDEEVRRALGDIIAHEVKDDRLSPMTSVTRVEVTTDLKFAKVAVSVYGTEEEKERTMEALRHAAGFLRTKLAQRVDLRRAPELSFELDRSVDHSVHIASILDKVRSEDDNAE